MIRKTLTILSLVGLGLASCCPPDAFDCTYIPVAIEGCPTDAVSVGKPFELFTPTTNQFPGSAFVWSLLTDEGPVATYPIPVEELGVVFASQVTFARIEITPKQEGIFTLTADLLFQDTTNLAPPPICTFEVVSE